MEHKKSFQTIIEDGKVKVQFWDLAVGKSAPNGDRRLYYEIILDAEKCRDYNYKSVTVYNIQRRKTYVPKTVYSVQGSIPESCCMSTRTTVIQEFMNCCIQLWPDTRYLFQKAREARKYIVGGLNTVKDYANLVRIWHYDKRIETLLMLHLPVPITYNSNLTSDSIDFVLRMKDYTFCRINSHCQFEQSNAWSWTMLASGTRWHQTAFAEWVKQNNPDYVLLSKMVDVMGELIPIDSNYRYISVTNRQLMDTLSPKLVLKMALWLANSLIDLPLEQKAQGVYWMTQTQDVARHYFDYLYVCHNEGHDISDEYWWKNRDWMEEHHRQLQRANELRALADNREKQVFAQKVEYFKDCTLDMNGYHLYVAPLEDWKKQAQELHQCILSAQYYKRTQSLLVFIRKDDVPIATVEFDVISARPKQAHANEKGDDTIHEDVQQCIDKYQSMYRNRMLAFMPE